MAEPEADEIAMGGGVEGCAELADELGDGETGGGAEGFEIDWLVVARVNKVFGDAESFVDL